MSELTQEYFIAHEEYARDVIEEAGFFAMSYGDMQKLLEKSPVDYAKNEGNRLPIVYSAHGSPDAPYVIGGGTQFFGRVEQPHHRIRRVISQAVLDAKFGEGVFRTVEAATHDPAPGTYTKNDMELMRDGIFDPQVARMRLAFKAAGVKPAQKIGTHGVSGSASAGIEFVRQALHGQLGDDFDARSLSAWEAPRSVQRGAGGVALAFMTSGKEGFRSIVDGGARSILEARGIDLSDKQTELKKTAKDLVGMAGYLRESWAGNMAIMRGFGTDKDVRRIEELASNTDVAIMYGRRQGSTVTDLEAYLSLQQQFADREKFYTANLEGDHSTDDNVIKSCGGMIAAAELMLGTNGQR